MKLRKSKSIASSSSSSVAQPPVLPESIKKQNTGKAQIMIQTLDDREKVEIHSTQSFRSYKNSDSSFNRKSKVIKRLVNTRLKQRI